MTTTKKPEKYQVITSERFRYGVRSYDGVHDTVGRVIVGGDHESEIEDASDLTRAQAKFLVESVVTRDPGCFGSFRGYTVLARRLNDDLTYDPSGELVQFTLGGRTEKSINEVSVIGRMRLVFEPEAAMTPEQSSGSHSLASQYMVVPPSLDTIGTDYRLPMFPPADPQGLAGARVLVICADGPELPEVHVPIEYLRMRGAQVQLAGQDWIFQWRQPAAHIVIGEWLSDRICVKADLRLSDVRLEDYDAVFIPGGAWNPDMLRTDDSALRLVRQAHERGLLVVSLCHGPQVIISAAFDAPEGQQNFPSDRVHITGTASIRRDLKNAGFVVHNDDSTVYDERANLLTARDPNDLGSLCEKFGELLRQRIVADNTGV